MNNAIIPNSEIKLFQHFDLFQLIRYLKQYHSNEQTLIEFKYKDSLDLSYPISSIKSIKKNMKDYELEIQILGLLGVKGTLPLHDKVHVINLEHKKNTVLKNFLNSFQQFFFEILVSVYENQRFYTAIESFIQQKEIHKNYADFITILSEFVGLPRHLLKISSLNFPPEWLLYFSQSFSVMERNKHQLEKIVAHIFSVKCEIIDYEPHPQYLAHEYLSKLDRINSYNQLGINLFLGSVFFNLKGNLIIIIKHFNYRNYMAFLPHKRRFKQFLGLIKYYFQSHMHISIKCFLTINVQPILKLSRRKIFALGWNCWLGQRHNLESLDGFCIFVHT